MKKKVYLLIISFIFIATVVSYQLFHSVKVYAPFVNQTYEYKINKVNYFYNKPKKHPSKIKIKIIKSIRALELYGDGNLMGKFKIGLGNEPSGDKLKEGDGKTPNGTFYVCTRLDKSHFKFFLGISYPNKEDAQRGLSEGLISQSEYEKINQSINNKQVPLWNTSLGGAVGIHGYNNSSDWTAGCIALSESDINVVWLYAKMGTPVEIVE